jgi:hypothetical protein
MFVTIEHDIHDTVEFQSRAERAMPPPEGLHVHQFLPASDLSHATCLYEADSLEAVRAFVDGALGSSTTQRYFPVAEAHAMGLPARRRG